MADPETTEMPGGDMVEPPKGRKKPTEMPSGAMETPAQVPKQAAAAKRGSPKKKGGTR